MPWTRADYKELDRYNRDYYEKKHTSIEESRAIAPDIDDCEKVLDDYTQLGITVNFAVKEKKKFTSDKKRKKKKSRPLEKRK